MKLKLLNVFLFIFAVNQVKCLIPVAQLLREVIQSNVFGSPLTHNVLTFEFDPDVAKKRRSQFYEVHGYKGDKAIQRIGLGIDGKHEERLAEQQARDLGHLQGANYRVNYSFLRRKNY